MYEPMTIIVTRVFTNFDLKHIKGPMRHAMTMAIAMVDI